MLTYKILQVRILYKFKLFYNLFLNSLGHGAYTFRIHGQTYHKIGSLLPEPNKPPTYAQLYILDSKLAVKERLGKTSNKDLDRTILT